MKRFVPLIAAVAGCALALGGGVARATNAHAAASLPTITLAVDGKTVTVGGQEVSGAVNIRTTVTQEALGEPTLVRLNPGVTFAQAQATIQSHRGDVNALDGLATIVFNQDASRGATTLGQVALQPGDYVALDTGKGGGRAPHTTFAVAENPSPAALPAASATVSAHEFGFSGPTVLHAGTIVRGVNDGWLVHMIDAQGVRSAADGLKVMALLRAGKDRQAQKLSTNAFFSLAEPISHGAAQQMVLNAKPGWYVQACFMTTQDGREHTQLGMERLIRVVK